jgi:hypothetical protein
LDFGAEHKDELAARAAVRRLCSLLELSSTDEDLVAGLSRLMAASAWNEAVRDQVLEWWRSFAHTQSTSRLSKLDKLLEAGSRDLEAARVSVHTLLALRRMFGKRSLREFADDIHQAYTTLQALASAFEDDAKRAANFDVLAARVEFAAHEGLTPQERQILASDIKELASLIGEMGDHRTKARLIRREEDIDRQLMRAEQVPHSTVDMLKWLSGYLSGLQDEPDSDD